MSKKKDNANEKTASGNPVAAEVLANAGSVDAGSGKDADAADAGLQEDARVERVEKGLAKVAVAKELDKDHRVLFVSRDPALSTLVMRVNGKNIRPTWTKSNEVLVWKVELADVDSFSNHVLVKHGRIVQALD